MNNNVSSLLIGKKNNYNFGNLLVGSKRLKDYDKDGVPDIFDCQWRNPKKDSTVDNKDYEYPSSTMSANEIALWEQAANLIFKGKAWVAGQDPQLRRKVNYLSAQGYRSAESMIQESRARLLNQQIQQETGQVYYDALGQPMSADPTKTNVTLPTAPTTMSIISIKLLQTLFKR